MKKIFLLLILTSCSKDKVTEIPESGCIDTISYSTTILPMISTYCFDCHDNTSPILTDFSSISSSADKILKSIKGESKLMPEGGPKLNDSLIDQFSCWILQGKQNN